MRRHGSMRLRIASQRRLIPTSRSLCSVQMDGMVGQHSNEQVCTDTGVGAMPDRAQTGFGQLALKLLRSFRGLHWQRTVIKPERILRGSPQTLRY